MYTFHLITGLTQFTVGKTKTALDTMKAMCDSVSVSEGRLVHFIFANNNIMEVEQWLDRVSRTIQQEERYKKFLMFSSSSDTSNLTDVYLSIIEDPKVDYVVMCSHAKRMDNIFNVKDGILQRLNKNHPHIRAAIWFDEFHENHNLAKQYIYATLTLYPNVIRYTGITATPSDSMWDTLQECGFDEDVQLMHTYNDQALQLYRSFFCHRRISMDAVVCTTPAELLEHVLNNRDRFEVSLTSILFAASRHVTKTHDESKEIALQHGCNVAVLNGKVKAIFRYDGKEFPLDGSGTTIENLRDTYLDPSKGLLERPLVITGFNCISTGVTINIPGFHMTHALFCRNSTSRETMIQVAGRVTGHCDLTKEMILIVDDETYESISDDVSSMIQFLQSKPKKMSKYSLCMTRNRGERSAIPVRLDFVDEKCLENVQELTRAKKLSQSMKRQLHMMLRDGVENGCIVLQDNNTAPYRYDFNRRVLNVVRRYRQGSYGRVQNRYANGQDDDACSFVRFQQAFEKNEGAAQTMKTTDAYALDLALDDYVCPRTKRRNPRNVGWITFRVNPQSE